MKETPNKTIKRLREEKKELEQTINELREDQRKFREIFVHNLKCSIEMLGKNSTWDMTYVVTTLAQQMTKFQRWYWG